MTKKPTKKTAAKTIVPEFEDGVTRLRRATVEMLAIAQTLEKSNIQEEAMLAEASVGNLMNLLAIIRNVEAARH